MATNAVGLIHRYRWPRNLGERLQILSSIQINRDIVGANLFARRRARQNTSPTSWLPQDLHYNPTNPSSNA